MTTGQKIKELRIKNKMTMEELGDKIGQQKQTIYKYEQGIVVNLKRDVIQKLSTALNTTPGYLMGWHQDKHSVADNNDVRYSIEGVNKFNNFIPVVGNVACGTPILARENIQSYISFPQRHKVNFALECVGDSMCEAGINNGDIVLVRSQPTVENGEIAAVRIGDDATIKRVYFSDNQIVLNPENKNYSPMIFSKEDLNNVNIEGLVVGCIHWF